MDLPIYREWKSFSLWLKAPLEETTHKTEWKLCYQYPDENEYVFGPIIQINIKVANLSRLSATQPHNSSLQHLSQDLSKLVSEIVGEMAFEKEHVEEVISRN